MKNLTERGLLVAISVFITLVILLSLTGCSSTALPSQCQGLGTASTHDCVEAKRAHEELLRSGFYDGSSSRK